MYLRWIKYFCKVIQANGEGNVQLFTKSTNFFIFERKLALLVALHGESIWKGVLPDAVCRKKLGKSVIPPAIGFLCKAFT